MKGYRYVKVDARWCIAHNGFIDCDQAECDVARTGDETGKCAPRALHVKQAR